MKRISCLGIFFALLFIIGLTQNCAKKSVGSLGPYDEITLVADPADYELFKTELSAVFEKEVETPLPEKIFVINQVTPEEFTKLRRRRNIVLVSTLESQGETIELIKGMLPASEVPKVEQGQSFFFQKKDPWAYNQMLLVLVANNTETLKQKLLSSNDQLFNIFDERLTRLVKSEVFGEGEQKILAKNLQEKYGWSIRIQHDYQIFEEDEQNNYVLLLRDYPKRWICVAWYDTNDPSLMTNEWCINFRNEIFSYMKGKEIIDEKHTRVDTVEFYGKYALNLVGLYGGEDEDGWPKVYGGPFRSYFVYVEEDNRIYMVDYAIFAPDRDKKTYLRQLDIIANTFNTTKNKTEKVAQK